MVEEPLEMGKQSSGHPPALPAQCWQGLACELWAPKCFEDLSFLFNEVMWLLNQDD